MLLYVFAFSFQWDVAKLRLVKSSSVYPIPASLALSGVTHPNQAIFIPASSPKHPQCWPCLKGINGCLIMKNLFWLPAGVIVFRLD